MTNPGLIYLHPGGAKDAVRKAVTEMREAFGVRAYSAAFFCSPSTIVRAKRRGVCVR
jgi:hypothetical protein